MMTEKDKPIAGVFLSEGRSLKKLERMWAGWWKQATQTDRSPHLEGYVDLPSEQPMFRRAVMSYSPDHIGFDDLAEAKGRFAEAAGLTSSLLNIMPGLTTQNTPSDEWLFLENTLPAYDEWAERRQSQWALWNTDWGTQINACTAYLDHTVHHDVRLFLFQRKLSEALRELGCGPLLPGAPVSLRSLPDSPVYLTAGVILHDGLTARQLSDNADEIGSFLECGWLRMETPKHGRGMQALHVCAAHPDRTEFPPYADERMRQMISDLD